jgi:hypothetical protein
MTAPVSSKLKGYYRFRDFENIVKWLGGTLPPSTKLHTKALSSAIPNTLPRL